MNNIEKVNDYLSNAKTYYLTTVAGDKPKCRPIGLNILKDGKIFFGVGDHKEVYKQMQENANVEICAMSSSGFLRYNGKATFGNFNDVVEQALEEMPMLRNIYNDETGFKMAMFYLEDATAEFYSMRGLEETIKF